MANDTKEIINLEYPVMLDGKTFSSLEMRRPKVKDRLITEQASGSLPEKEVLLISSLCEVPRGVIEGLDMADYLKVQQVVAKFITGVE